MPRHFRSPRRLLLGGALVLALLGGSLSPAHADTPSPSPSPTPHRATPTASSSASATPTPTASASASETASSTSSAAARSTVAPTPHAGGRGWPKRVRSLFDLLERQIEAPDRQHLRALLDEDAGAFVIAGCAAPGVPTTADANYFSFDADDVDFDWTVTGAAGVVVDSGTGTVEDEEAQFTIEGLGRGNFTLDVTVGDQPEPSATLDFTVYDCITTTVSCKAVTFVNPAANPAALVLYGGPGTNLFNSEDDTDVAELPAGGEVTLRTALTEVGYGAIVIPDLDENENSFALSLVGEVDSLPVPNDCERPLSAVSVSCANDHPRLNVTFAREGSDQPVDFTVDNANGKTVARRFLDDGQTTATAKLPGPGRYTYRSYFDTDLAYEKVTVDVVSCGASAAPAGDGLADTGGPPLLPLPIGAALLGGAVLLLTRRTRPAR